MLGTSPKYMTIMQLLAIPIGAAAVAIMYPILKSQYGIGPDGLSSPISVKWAGFAEVLSAGLSALPPGAGTALLVGSVLGIILAILEMKAGPRVKKWVPSATGIGIGMLVPATVIVTMFLGSVIGAIWQKRFPKNAEAIMIPLASGLIAGEALIAVIVPILVGLGILKV
jgi:uncharacterized oligopeptide transporter (OPT) family protein